MIKEDFNNINKLINLFFQILIKKLKIKVNFIILLNKMS